MAALQSVSDLADVSSDQQDKGLQANVVIDRDTASRLGLSVGQIDNTLYDAFGQRQVSTVYVARNQYHVIMEVAPAVLAGPADAEGCLRQHLGRTGHRFADHQRGGRDRRVIDAGRRRSIRSRPARCAISRPTRSAPPARRPSSTGTAVSTSQETMIPLSSIARFGQDRTSLIVNHQDGLVANTISFNLADRRLALDGGDGDRNDHGAGSVFPRRSKARSRASPRSFRNRSAANRFSCSRRSRRSISRSACSMRALFIR